MTSSTIDEESVSTIRILCADIVQAANSGHPGMPMGMAPIAHVLFSRFLQVSNQDPKWPNRDRFVLSNGHGCALLYAMLHLSGFKIGIEDLKQFRQWGSKTPGHPEYGHTEGVEATTGPLGQGIGNAVGMAIAQVHMAAKYNRPGFEGLFNNFTFVFCGDGCLQEGVASEAASLAGHLRLGRLIIIYDDNKITIDGDTELSFTEDVPARFRAYGWHTLTVEKGNSDLESMEQAIRAAQAVTDRPSLISLKTTIGFLSSKQGTHGVHGSPLGKDDIAGIKSKCGFDPTKSFIVPDKVRQFWNGIAVSNQSKLAGWQALFAKYMSSFPEQGRELHRRWSGKLPEQFESWLPGFDPTKTAPMASRKSSQLVLNALGPNLPELMGGSADLTPSNLTDFTGSGDFQAKTPSGRYIRFGVREHGMAAIGNGLSLYGGIIPFTATFLNFITYAFPSVRLAALSKLRHLFVMTHDSIGLGEDGPTHQPVEVLALLRATPNLFLFRPADASEVSGSYSWALNNMTGPSVLALSRQNLPSIPLCNSKNVAFGAYPVLEPVSGATNAILISTGSEVHIAIAAAQQLATSGINVRVVSAPCLDLFIRQPLQYRLSVLPVGIPIISVEAQGAFGWSDYAHRSIAVKEWGASAPAETIYDQYGFTAPKIAKFVSDVKSSVPVSQLGLLRCQRD